jgi:hypothetical protein
VATLTAEAADRLAALPDATPRVSLDAWADDRFDLTITGL